MSTLTEKFKILLLITFCSFAFSQLAISQTACGTVEAGNYNECLGGALDVYEGICGGNSVEFVMTNIPGGGHQICNDPSSVYNNPSYFAFYANGEDYFSVTVSVIPGSCVNNGGIQAALLSVTDCSSADPIGNCQSQCSQGTFTMSTENHSGGPWIPDAGTIIVILLDGCNGDICTVNFTINSGWTNSPSAPDDAVLEQSILTTDDYLMCGLVEFYVDPPFEDVCEYVWHLPNGQTYFSDEPSVIINVSDWPDGTVCVQGANQDCFPGEFFPESNSVCFDFVGVELEAEVQVFHTECDLDNGILLINQASIIGTAPYNITWNFPTSDPYLNTDMPPGSYTVNIVDLKLCEFDQTVVIEDSEPLEITNVIVDDTDCDNSSGSILVEHNGDLDLHHFDYLWSPPNYNTAHIFDLAAGTYTVTIVQTGTEGCETEPIEIEVIVDGNSSVEIVSTAPSNCGEITGEIVFNVDGIGPFSYTLNGPGGPYVGNGTTITGLPAGQFVLVVDDLGSVCESLPINVLIPGTVGPDLEAGIDQSLCGTLTTTLEGVASAGVVEWEQVSGPSTAVFSDITQSNASITVTDYGVYEFRLTGSFDGCFGNPDIVQIEFNENPIIDYRELCDLSDLVFEADISNGFGVYTFTAANTFPGIINGDQITSTGILQGTNYNLQVQDEKGCVSPIYNLSHSGLPILDGEENYILGCDDGLDGHFLVDVDGESSPDTDLYSFNWDVTTGVGSVVGTTNEADFEGEGVYRLVVEKNLSGCQDTFLINVAINHDLPLIDIPSSIVIDCNTTLPIEVRDVSGAGNVEYTWTTPDGVIIDDNGSWITLEEVGTYRLEVKDTTNQCVSFDEVVVEDNRSVPDLSVLGDMMFNCFDNGLDTIVISTEVEDASITWFSATPDIVESFDGVNLIVNSGGAIQIIIEDLDNGCIDTTLVNIDSSLDEPIFTVDNNFILDCVTGLDSSININVDAHIDILWTTINGTILSGENDPRVYIRGGGLYSFELTDPINGCVDTGSVHIGLDADLPEIFVDEELLNFYCNSNELLLSASSNVGPTASYLWTASFGGNIVGEDTLSQISINQPGTYTVIVTNPINNCMSSKNIIVEDKTQSPGIEVDEDKTMTCFDEGQISITGTSVSDVTFAWTDQIGNTYPSTSTITVDTGGIYTLIVTDIVSGCMDTASVVISEDLVAPMFDLPAGPTITCFTELTGVEITPNSLTTGAQVEWSTSVTGGLGSTEADGSFVALKPGIFNALVTNPTNGCTSINSIEVFGDFEKPDVNAGTDQFIDCREPEATLTGSSITTGAIYTWTTNNGVIESNPNSSTIQVTGTGIYTLTIQDPNNGCTETDDVQVMSLVAEPHVEAGPNIVLGCGDFNTVQQIGNSNTPGVEYLWTTTNGNIIGDVNSPIISINQPGNYVLEVTDPNTGCTSRDFFEATNTTDLPIANAGERQELTCSVESVTLDGSGSSGNNLSYNWTKVGETNPLPGATNAVITVTTAGTYLLTLTNTANGCTDESLVEVFAQDDVLSDVVVSDRDISCYGQNDGSIQILELVGGVAPFEVVFNGQNVGDTRNFSQLVPGSYTLEITDINGCKVEKPITIDEPSELTSSLGSNVTIKKGEGVHLDLIYGGGSGIQTIIWDTLGVEFCENCLSVDLIPSRSMNVNVFVIDSSGCTTEAFMRIIVERDIHVYVPNVISPKKDNNNLLTIYAGKQVVNVESFIVFDRWGNYLYRDENFKPNDDIRGWDGTYNGKFVTSGVYVYSAQVILDDGTKRIISGDVTVLY